ncbi:hypothetical protein FVE85_0852 [Porphyridium purpureum]|uniref:Uncharacterized protein n=1 Tax=Porphyridium purpureum TaxID=35688 RepID=A0A5J4Z2I2_PORPP|nr:hypothetical protein FVE85_0852 [Porphyridium purpureum]|eukprot:POR2086..scf208_2
MFGKRMSFKRDMSSKELGEEAGDSSGGLDQKGSGMLPRVPSMNRFSRGQQGASVSDVGPRTESTGPMRRSSSSKNVSMPRTSSSTKLERAPSFKKIERSTSYISTEKGGLSHTMDPNEGAMFRSMSAQRKNRIDVFRHLSAATAEKTSFQSKLKYEEIMFEVEETLLAQDTTTFQRQKNTLWYSTKLKRGWHMGEIRILEVIGQCRVEFRRATGCKVDYWTFVEYYRRFVREIRARVPEAVEMRSTVRDQYRAQKQSQKLQEMRQKALQVEEERSKVQPSSPEKHAADVGEAEANGAESEYQRLQNLFHLEDEEEDDLHDLADVTIISPGAESKSKFTLRSSGHEVMAEEARKIYDRTKNMSSEDSHSGAAAASLLPPPKPTSPPP